MVLGVCSDPHLHTTRLAAFADQARAAGADELWCLGDVVDALLGAPPEAHAATVAVAVDRCDLLLGGNHELWALQRGLLDAQTAEVVAGWVAADERHDVTAVHASLRDPVMEFVTDAKAAAGTLGRQPDWLALHGHTHRRRLWQELPSFPHAASASTRGVVDAGDGRWLACPGALTGARPTWLRVDLEARTLEWRALR